MTNSERATMAEIVEAAWQHDQARQSAVARELSLRFSGTSRSCQCDVIMSTRGVTVELPQADEDLELVESWQLSEVFEAVSRSFV